MAESKQKVERRQYTDEFQLEAVRLADSVGLNAAADRLDAPAAQGRAPAGRYGHGCGRTAQRRRAQAARCRGGG
jgi:hypothetical protein